MHLGNGTVTLTCAAWGLALAGSTAALALSRLRQRPTPAPSHFAWATAAVFALQALNLPVLPGVSGHLIGGFLLACWFGAAWGLMGITLVLAAQALLFGDGGWISLGLNIINMGVVSCVAVYPLWKAIAGDSTGARRWLSLAVAAWCATVLGAAACGIELASVTGAGWMGLSRTLIGVHLMIGLIEAVITIAALALVQRMSRADWPAWAAPAAIGGLMLVAAFGASPWPDGLEYALHHHGLSAVGSVLMERLDAVQAAVAPFADYTLAAGLVASAIVALAAGVIAHISAASKARIP